MAAPAVVGGGPVPVRAAAPAPVRRASDAVSAGELARRTGQRVEVLSERSETSQTFANPDGTFTFEVLPGVDLQVTAEVNGYREVLVVKDRAAASNPALHQIRFGLVTDGVSAAVREDGGLVAANYPVMIDPSSSTVTEYNRTHINENSPSQSYWEPL